LCAAGPLLLRGRKRRSRRKSRREEEERIARNGKEEEKEERGKGGMVEHDSRERRKTGCERAYNLRAHHTSQPGRPRQREVHTFSSLGIKASGRFSAARVSREELVRSLQNTENTCLTLNYHAPSFNPVVFSFF